MPSLYSPELSVPLSLSTLELTCMDSYPPSLHSPQTSIRPQSTKQGLSTPRQQEYGGGRNVKARVPAFSLCTLRALEQEEEEGIRKRE